MANTHFKAVSREQCVASTYRAHIYDIMVNNNNKMHCAAGYEGWFNPKNVQILDISRSSRITFICNWTSSIRSQSSYFDLHRSTIAALTPAQMNSTKGG